MRIKSRADCPFCEGNIEDAVFASSDNFRAIYNIAPILRGHSLIVPKSHVRRFVELSDDEIFELIEFSKKVSQRLGEIVRASGFNWTLQDGVTAGQTIAHLHIHLIPRHSADLNEPGDWYPMLKGSELGNIDSKSRQRLNKSERAKIVSDLKEQFEPRANKR